MFFSIVDMTPRLVESGYFQCKVRVQRDSETSKYLTIHPLDHELVTYWIFRYRSSSDACLEADKILHLASGRFENVRAPAPKVRKKRTEEQKKATALKRAANKKRKQELKAQEIEPKKAQKSKKSSKKNKKNKENSKNKNSKKNKKTSEKKKTKDTKTRKKRRILVQVEEREKEEDSEVLDIPVYEKNKKLAITEYSESGKYSREELQGTCQHVDSSAWKSLQYPNGEPLGSFICNCCRAFIM